MRICKMGDKAERSLVASTGLVMRKIYEIEELLGISVPDVDRDVCENVLIRNLDNLDECNEKLAKIISVLGVL